jgi:hypothetical protein
MEFDVSKSDKDGDALIGCSWLLGGLLFGAAGLVGSIGAWGFLCYASFLVLCAFLLFCWARRMGRMVADALRDAQAALDEPKGGCDGDD